MHGQNKKKSFKLLVHMLRYQIAEPGNPPCTAETKWLFVPRVEVM
jgi:hypothetical protein